MSLVPNVTARFDFSPDCRDELPAGFVEVFGRPTRLEGRYPLLLDLRGSQRLIIHPDLTTSPAPWLGSFLPGFCVWRWSFLCWRCRPLGLLHSVYLWLTAPATEAFLEPPAASTPFFFFACCFFGFPLASTVFGCSRDLPEVSPLGLPVPCVFVTNCLSRRSWWYPQTSRLPLGLPRLTTLARCVVPHPNACLLLFPGLPTSSKLPLTLAI